MFSCVLFFFCSRTGYDASATAMDGTFMQLPLLTNITVTTFDNAINPCNSNLTNAIACDDYHECINETSYLNTTLFQAPICCRSFQSCSFGKSIIASIPTIDTININQTSILDIIDNVALRCDSHSSCAFTENLVIAHPSGPGNLYFTGSGGVGSWIRTDDAVVDTGDKENYDIFCSGSISCRYQYLQNSNNLWCFGDYSCFQSPLITDINNVYVYSHYGAIYSQISDVGNVYCGGGGWGCQRATITNVEYNVYGSGYQIMYLNTISNIGGSLGGMGYQALKYATISNVTNIACISTQSCANSTIRGIHGSLIANGENALSGSVIISESNTDLLFIFINGTNDDIYEIYCNGTNICKIKCQSGEACTNLYLYCPESESCFVDCNPFATVQIQCPRAIVGSYKEWTTNEPTQIPSTSPTVLPTVDPTKNPSVASATVSFTSTTVNTTINTTIDTTLTSSTTMSSTNNSRMTIAMTTEKTSDESGSNEGSMLSSVDDTVFIVIVVVVFVFICILIGIIAYLLHKQRSKQCEKNANDRKNEFAPTGKRATSIQLIDYVVSKNPRLNVNLASNTTKKNRNIEDSIDESIRKLFSDLEESLQNGKVNINGIYGDDSEQHRMNRFNSEMLYHNEGYEDQAMTKAKSKSKSKSTALTTLDEFGNKERQQLNVAIAPVESSDDHELQQIADEFERKTRTGKTTNDNGQSGVNINEKDESDDDAIGIVDRVHTIDGPKGAKNNETFLGGNEDPALVASKVKLNSKLGGLNVNGVKPVRVRPDGITIEYEDTNYVNWSQKQVIVWLKDTLLRNNVDKKKILAFLKEFARKNVTGRTLAQFHDNPAWLDGFVMQFSEENQNCDDIWGIIKVSRV